MNKEDKKEPKLSETFLAFVQKMKLWAFSIPVVSLLSSLLLLNESFSQVDAVKLEDFKRCDQSGFCRRQRAWADFHQQQQNQANPFSLNQDSVKFHEKEGRVTGTLIHSGNQQRFSVDIQLLEEVRIPPGTAKVKHRNLKLIRESFAFKSTKKNP